MKKDFNLLFVCLFVSALFANTNAVAGNWNSGSGANDVEHGNKSSYRFIEAEGKIPLHQKHSLAPKMITCKNGFCNRLRMTWPLPNPHNS